jgi:hypothetical protein
VDGCKELQWVRQTGVASCTLALIVMLSVAGCGSDDASTNGAVRGGADLPLQNLDLGGALPGRDPSQGVLDWLCTDDPGPLLDASFSYGCSDPQDGNDSVASVGDGGPVETRQGVLEVRPADVDPCAGSDPMVGCGDSALSDPLAAETVTINSYTFPSDWMPDSERVVSYVRVPPRLLAALDSGMSARLDGRWCGNVIKRPEPVDKSWYVSCRGEVLPEDP